MLLATLVAVYSFITIIITCSNPAIYTCFALSKDVQFPKFYGYIVFPINFTALAISLVLRPRDESISHILLLCLQFSILTFGTEVLFLMGYEWDQAKIMGSAARIFVYMALIPILRRFRSRAARLSDADLSEFLTISVFKGR